MSSDLAPRPHNEARRIEAVIQTGLIAAPQPELFQVYCDLAKDLTGFHRAIFSLFDGDSQCAMANSGFDDEFVVGNKGERNVNNICSYVLLSPNPLLMPDLRLDDTWKHHPAIMDGTSRWYGYAGFPIINKDNYALGTLCMLHEEPRAVSEGVIPLIQKITNSMAHLLDLQIEQKQVTSEKMLDALRSFMDGFPSLTLDDFRAFLSASADMPIDAAKTERLVAAGLIEPGRAGSLLSEAGQKLQVEMKIQPKPMNRFKVEGEAASTILDEMLTNLAN